MKKLILFSFVCFCMISCFDSRPPCEKYYSFRFPTTITPQDTFHIGDTIWCEMDLPNQILDRNSGEYIDLTNFDFYFTTNISKIDTTIVHGAMYSFDLHAEVGSIEQHTNYFIYTYIHFKSVTEKKFKLGYIPKRKGTFHLGIDVPTYFLEKDSESHSNQNLKITNTECREYWAFDSGAPINNGNVNYYLIDGSCQFSPYDSLIVCVGSYQQHLEKGGYAFVVN